MASPDALAVFWWWLSIDSCPPHTWLLYYLVVFWIIRRFPHFLGVRVIGAASAPREIAWNRVKLHEIAWNCMKSDWRWTFNPLKMTIFCRHTPLKAASYFIWPNHRRSSITTTAPAIVRAFNPAAFLLCTVHRTHHRLTASGCCDSSTSPIVESGWTCSALVNAPCLSCCYTWD